MKNPELLAKEIVKRFREKGVVQVPGYNVFKYVSDADKSVTILREKGTQAKIPLDKLKAGIEAVQKNPSTYERGPNSLRPYGITHINSPIWAMLHLLDKTEYED